MRKMFAVLKREYLVAVRKKMFIFMTIFFPVLISAALILPGLMMAKGLGEKKVVVLDGTGALSDAFSPTALARRSRGRQNAEPLQSKLHVEYVDAKRQPDL